MESNRLIGHAPRSRNFGERLYASEGICIGCKGCTGICPALIEALSLPDAILSRAS